MLVISITVQRDGAHNSRRTRNAERQEGEMVGRDVTSAYLAASCFVKSAVPTFTIVPRG